MKFMVFKKFNNEAEYEALLAGMEIRNVFGVECLKAFSDSWLVVGEVSGKCEAYNPTMVASMAKVNDKSSLLKKFTIKHVPRLENQQVDVVLKHANSFTERYQKSIRWKILS